MYSAVKINGQKLYELARRGREWSASPGDHHLRAGAAGRDRPRGIPPAVPFVPKAPTSAPSATTWVEIWVAAGPCRLRRTMAGAFRLEDAVTLEAFSPKRGISSFSCPPTGSLPILPPTRALCRPGKAHPQRESHHGRDPAGRHLPGLRPKRRFSLPLPGTGAAFSPPSRISLEGDFVHERKSHCIGLL